MGRVLVTKEQSQVVFAVVFGNILEWFEIYSFAYLAPVLSQVFFRFNTYEQNLFSVFVTFGLAFVARPFGAMVFGRIGDLVGRKFSFILSIFILSLPTFLMGFLPTYEVIGIFAPLLLVMFRSMQAMAAAGEVPGTACFLYEYASPNNKRYLTSWCAVGNQIGAIVAIFETFFIDRYCSHEFILSYGWRISFWTGGFIGLLGFYLRKRLHETPVFRSMKEHHTLDRETVWKVVVNQKKNIGLGFCYCVLNASTFYLIATYIPTYFDEMYGLSLFENSVIALMLLVLLSGCLPLFGWLGDRFNNKVILISCAVLSIILLYPIYVSINEGNHILLIVTGLAYILPISGMTALLVYRGCRLFTPQVRYTGLAMAFNLSDGIVGGFTPAISLFLVSYTNNHAAFIWFILACGIVSLLSYFRIKE